MRVLPSTDRSRRLCSAPPCRQQRSHLRARTRAIAVEEASAHAAAAEAQDRTHDAAAAAPAAHDDFSSIEDAIAAVARGEFVLVLDDEDRENEGDLILAADKATPGKIAYMVNRTSGVLCVGLPAAECARLELPLMVPTAENEEEMYTAFTVTVDLREGVTTGISASDRCATIRALGSAATQAADLRKPGHIFPLIAREHGVLARPGHTEAAVDLARLAGCQPAGVLCEVVDAATGEMAQTPQLLAMAREEGMCCVTIQALIQHRVAREATCRVVEGQQLAAHGERWQCIECCDGRRAAFVATGDVASGRPHVDVIEVEGPSAASWEGAEARLQALDTAIGAGESGRVCVALFAAPGVDSSKQGAALPGMAVAALLTALEACGCAKGVQTTSSVVQDALLPFGYGQQL